MGGGYISKKSMDNIFNMCKNYSRIRGRIRANKITGKIVGVMKTKINDLIENMKIDILNSLSNILDTLQKRRRKYWQFINQDVRRSMLSMNVWVIKQLYVPFTRWTMRLIALQLYPPSRCP